MRLESIEAIKSNVAQAVKLLFEVEDCLVCTDLSHLSEGALMAACALKARLDQQPLPTFKPVSGGENPDA